MNINVSLAAMYGDEINELADMLDLYLAVAKARLESDDNGNSYDPGILAAYFTALAQAHQTPMSLSHLQDSLDGIGADIQQLGEEVAVK